MTLCLSHKMAPTFGTTEVAFSAEAAGTANVESDATLTLAHDLRLIRIRRHAKDSLARAPRARVPAPPL